MKASPSHNPGIFTGGPVGPRPGTRPRQGPGRKTVTAGVWGGAAPVCFSTTMKGHGDADAARPVPIKGRYPSPFTPPTHRKGSLYEGAGRHAGDMFAG